MFLIRSICLSCSAVISFISYYLVPGVTILNVLFLLKILNIFTVIYALINFNHNKKHLNIQFCKENSKEIKMGQRHYIIKLSSLYRKLANMMWYNDRSVCFRNILQSFFKEIIVGFYGRDNIKYWLKEICLLLIGVTVFDCFYCLLQHLNGWRVCSEKPICFL